ncbi:MAG: sigma 54-interacting transcriptional regulator [Bacillota bacterium]
MTALQMIAPTAQEVAEAISASLGMEAQIVDDSYNVIAGTGKYRDMVGGKEYEAVYPDSPYLYGRVFRTGQSFIIEDAPRNELYGPVTLGEMSEICCPIHMGEKVIGVIALVAFNDEQKNNLLQKREILQHFLKHMAQLLANTVAAARAYKQLKITTNQLETVVESFPSGVLTVNSEGMVIHCNNRAAEIIGIKKDDLIEKAIEHFWPDSPVRMVLKSGEGYSNKEEFYNSSFKNMHLLVSATPLIVDNLPSGALVTFSEMAEARSLAYHLTDTQHDLHFNHIVGSSKPINSLKEQALQVARGNSTILITGESGTGKELFARAIHYASPRRDKPLVIVNCGAIPETLLESELFGYEEGAFTGARKGGRAGKFELANGGTIFFDEIGDLPLHLQVKLLHVLQRRQVERVGGNKIIPVNVRIIAATNRNLEAMCEAGEFREDLYYRLGVIPLVIPPLRERKDDIPELTGHFIKKYNPLLEKDIRGYTDEVKKMLLSYHWPGNVRELENCIEYAVNMEAGSILYPESLPSRIRSSQPAPRDYNDFNLSSVAGRAEKAAMKALLEKAARQEVALHELPGILGVSRATFYRKLKVYRLEIPMRA